MLPFTIVFVDDTVSKNYWFAEASRFTKPRKFRNRQNLLNKENYDKKIEKKETNNDNRFNKKDLNFTYVTVLRTLRYCKAFKKSKDAEMF